ncbi:MAG: P-loop NTPase fold protein, partial [Actinomycetota bacterium]
MAVREGISLDSGLTALRGAAVSPSGRLAVTYGVDVLIFSLTVWDVGTRTVRQQIETSRAPMSVRFTPDGQAIVGAFLSRDDDSAQILRWPLDRLADGGESVHTEPGVAGLAMSRDTSAVAFRRRAGGLVLLDVRTGKTASPRLSAQFDRVAISAQAHRIALAAGRQIHVYHRPGGPAGPLTLAGGPEHRVSFGEMQSLDCSANQTFVASGSSVWLAGEDEQSIIFTAPGPVRRVGVSTGGDLLAVAHGDEITLVEPAKRTVIDQLQPASPVHRLTFSLDDRFLITADDDNAARLWDLTRSAAGTGAVQLGSFSPSSLRVLAYADALRRALGRGEVHLDHLLVGVDQAVESSAQQVLDRTGVGRAGFRSALQTARGTESLPTVIPGRLESMPPLSPHAGEALERSAGVAATAGSAVIRSQDLLRGALSVTDCSFVQALAQQGIDLAAIDAGDEPPPAPQGRAPLLAGAAADTVPEPGEGRVRQADRLGIAAEVEMLVSILMARDTPLPLAVGLFGDWGSGKSFFMALMQERIAELARLSSAGRPEAAPFCQQVRQVRFNAWHYVDTDLWASLAATLFDELARTGAPDAAQTKLAQLDEAREIERHARKKRQEQEIKVEGMAADSRRATAAAATAVPVAIHAARRAGLRKDLVNAKNPASEDYDVIRLANVLGQLDGAAVRAGAVWRLFLEEVRYRRTWATAVTLAVFLGGAVLAWVLGTWPTGPKVLTLAAGLIAGFTPALAGVQQVLHLAKEAREA